MGLKFWDLCDMKDPTENDVPLKLGCRPFSYRVEMTCI